MQLSVRHIPNGEAGTDATLHHIGRLVERANKDQGIRLLALKILRRNRVDSKQPWKAAQALYSWVRSNVKYVKDPVDVETVQAPQVTTRLKAGDCDDHAALMVALSEAVGIPARFVVIGRHRDAFEHIYPELLLRGKWTPADTTGQLPFGRVVKLPSKKIYLSKGDAFMTMSGSALGSRPVRVLRVPRDTVKLAAYKGAMKVLKNNWNRGRINAQDVRSYLRVIAEGNGPGRGTIVEKPMQKAIQDFLYFIEKSGTRSGKPAKQLSGLEGLDGFLKSVWSGVKGAVNTAVGVVAGAGIPVVSSAAGSVQSIISGGGGGGQPGSFQGGKFDEGLEYGLTGEQWSKIGHFWDEIRQRGLPHRAAMVQSGAATTNAQAEKMVNAVARARLQQGLYIRDDLKKAHLALNPDLTFGSQPGATVPTYPGQTTAADSSLFQFSPQVNVPEGMIHTQVTPEAARAGVGAFLSDPKVLMVLAGAGVLMFTTMRKGR